MGKTLLQAVEGWIGLRRYGIQKLTLCGEKMLADHETVDTFKIEVEEIIEVNTYNQIFYTN